MTVGDDTLATTDNGGDVNLFTLQDPRNETYTVTVINQDGNSSQAVPSTAVARLKVVHLAGFKQPLPPKSGPGFNV